MQQRIATLDGIRGLCILSVLVAHVSGTGVIPLTRFAHVAGDLGVRGFFVLSGYLITTLLVRELDRPAPAVLRGFYLRRALRIFPAFYAFLGGVMLLSTLGLTSWNQHDAVFAATYTMNFHGERVWSLGHLWSLAVEEQFYLLWPALLVFLGIARARRALLAALVLAPIARLVTWHLYPALADQAFPCVCDSLATGCLLAVLPRIPRVHPLWIIPALASLLVTRAWFNLGIASTAANLGLAIAIERALALRPRILESRILVRLGVLSYSIYLWQQIFNNRHASEWFNRFPINVVLAITAGALSYALVEQPFLRLKALVSRYPQPIRSASGDRSRRSPTAAGSE
jgi:peptidoglycan/LPS O-acetylase OafA/YrhL